jgi:hypothetical protein
MGGKERLEAAHLGVGLTDDQTGDGVVTQVLDRRPVDRDEHVMHRDLVRQVPLVMISLYM